MTRLGTATNVVTGTPTPPGVYVLKLKEITEEDSQYSDDGQFKWIFTIERVISSRDEDAENFIGEEQWGFSSTGLGPKHKARGWVECLLQRKLEEGDDIQIEDLLGKRVIGTVKAATRKDGSEGSKLAELEVYNAGGRKKAPKPPVDDDDEDDNF